MWFILPSARKKSLSLCPTEQRGASRRNQSHVTCDRVPPVAAVGGPRFAEARTEDASCWEMRCLTADQRKQCTVHDAQCTECNFFLGYLS